MKKIIIILFIIASIYLTINSREIIIPKDSIRFRIIANSNSLEDQAIKTNIKNKIIKKFISKANVNTYLNAKEYINDTISDIKDELNKYNVKYKINFGNNYFPKKTYKGVVYPEGNYESLVITLDEGLGDNYWCVLYPPLCMVEDNKSDNIEYKSLVSDILKNYKKNVN